MNWVTCCTFSEVEKSPTSAVRAWFWVVVEGGDQDYSFEHVNVEMYINKKCQLGNWACKFGTQWGCKFGSHNLKTHRWIKSPKVRK